MNFFEVLGIKKNTPIIIVWGLFILALFGFAVTGLFECWKFLLSIFLPDKYPSPDCWEYIIYLSPFFIFCLTGLFIYWRYKPKQCNVKSYKVDESKRRGLIFVLSKPPLLNGVTVNSNVTRILNKIK